MLLPFRRMSVESLPRSAAGQSALISAAREAPDFGQEPPVANSRFRAAHIACTAPSSSDALGDTTEAMRGLRPLLALRRRLRCVPGVVILLGLSTLSLNW